MKPEQIEVPVWWKNGSMIFNRDHLEINHPESTYNYIKNKLNLNPEDYGYYKYDPEKFKIYLEKSKEELITMIFDLEKELEYLYSQI